MRIVNHKISIVRGETPLYKASLKLADDTPYFFLIADQNRYAVEFVIRPSIYSKDNDFIFRRYLLIPDTIKKFASNLVVDLPEGLWEDDVGPIAGAEDSLHRMKVGGLYEYAYHDGTDWIPYNFPIQIQFPYSETSKFEPKTYFYEINIVGGALKTGPIEVGEIPVEDEPIGVFRKIPVLTAREFRVEGSIGA